MAGVTNEGFVLPTLQELLDATNADTLSTVDAGLDLSPDQPYGQMNAIVARQLALVWEGLQETYNAFDPDAAQGRALENLAALTGTVRSPARSSTVSCNCTVNAGVTIPVGAVINVSGHPEVRFVSTEAKTNSGGSPATLSVKFASESPGPIVATAGTLTVITNPISGWTAVTNPLDATLGALAEEDTALRSKREQELAAAGASTLDAMRADLLEVSGVIAADVQENTTEFTDANGLPPHSFEAIIYDGAVPTADDDDVAAIIWKNKPSGIQSYGLTSEDTVDAVGDVQTVYFSRCTPKNVYVSLTVSTDSNKFPADGAAQVKAAIVAAGAKFGLRGDAIALTLRAAALAVTGVYDVPTFTLGFSASPVGTANLAIAPREIAVFDTTRVVVTVT